MIGCLALSAVMVDGTVEEAMIGKVYILGSLGRRRAPVVVFGGLWEWRMLSQWVEPTPFVGDR